ncbi:hypothetical protein SAMD00019534_114780 [Acytostelium subglobosum LB1]|uniref:hypothetical protein n=1 Tax=Acytostelium subglobosum LB1 TaxID=1410327 RepID=UPI0006450DCC|nr:hypothetical protein SAMD00019534_114780 [Acytostelium subglobosum LB1]GAM28302.1 hypothetical protein SAMD00019534_114780 [Acytostelium subglobosum LB1]|eukprot:XP_012748619.1 hypothetical protein SAMD00019534_114780 [Acytostelium subglobosum LB1]
MAKIAELTERTKHKMFIADEHDTTLPASASQKYKYNMVLPSNIARVSFMDDHARTKIQLGNQRRIAALFKTLYHVDPITMLGKTFELEYEDDEWVEWTDERTGMRPIHLAVEKMDICLIKYLLDKKADVNIKDNQGWTPLHFAAYAGSLEICQLLIEQGRAAVMAISKDGTLPLHYLSKHKFDKTQSVKFRAVLSLLIAKGTPVNAKTIRGETALHRAALFGSVQGVTFLVEHKADINSQNARGETPLYFGVIGRQKKIVALLVEYGADCSLGGATGNALDSAKKTGQKDLYFFLSGFVNNANPFDDDDLGDDTEDQEQCSFGEIMHTDSSITDSRELSSLGPDELKRLQQDHLEEKLKEKSEKLKVNHANFYPHIFVLSDFKGPTWCSFCGYFLWGLRRQGFQCEICGYCVHPKCKKKATLTESCIISKQLNEKHNAESDTVEEFLSSSRLHVSQSLHKQSINRRRLESLYNQFNQLDKEQNGCLNRTQFGECLGSLISDSTEFAESLFQAFDSNHDGKMDLKDFLHGVSLMQNSSFEEQIRFAFEMLDRSRRGYITVAELLQILQSIHRSLGNLKINGSVPAMLICTIFPKSIVCKKILIPEPYYQPGKLSRTASPVIVTDRRIGNHRGSLGGSPATPPSLPTTTTTTMTIGDNSIMTNPHQDEEEDLSCVSFTSNNNNTTTGTSCTASPSSSVGSMTGHEVVNSHHHHHHNTTTQGSGPIPTTSTSTSTSQSPLPSPSPTQSPSHSHSQSPMRGTQERTRSFCFETYQSLPPPAFNPLAMAAMTAASQQNALKYREEYTNELNMEGRIYYDDYKQAITKNQVYVQSLGVVQPVLEGNTKTEDDPNQTSKWMSFEGKEITLGHENYELMQYMMIGIRRAIGESITLPSREIKPKDFELGVEFKFNGWTFKDHAPFVFKKIRDKQEIDPKHYMFSLGPEKIFGNLLMGNLSVLCEVVSSGRSGSMFFRSNEGRYLIKTIPSYEEAVLKSFLPSYIKHIEKYPNSLLTKTLGCYSMTKAKELKFIVMNNLFFTPLPIHEKYDLKGSTIGRQVQEDLARNGDGGGSASSSSSKLENVSLKDLDFKRKLNIAPEYKAPLMEQIEHDTKLLESNNICDYSLLVGVHRVDEFSPIALVSDDTSSQNIIDVLSEGFFKKKSGKTSIFHQHYGGILSADRKEVYFISIIDIFTSWDFRKKYEAMIKSLVHDSSQISAVDPASYRKRFQQLVHHIVK